MWTDNTLDHGRVDENDMNVDSSGTGLACQAPGARRTELPSLNDHIAKDGRVDLDVDDMSMDTTETGKRGC
jgi:hypothetical protein